MAEVTLRKKKKQKQPLKIVFTDEEVP